MKILLLISLIVSLAFASIGQVTGIKGSATLIRDSKSMNLTVGHKLEKKDIIKTADKSKVQVIFDDRTIITIGKKSSLNIEEYLYDTNNPSNSKLKLKFFKGAFKSISGKIGKVAPKRFKLKTKNATIGIRGTILSGNQTRVICIKGAITVSAQGVTQVVPAGMMTSTPAGAPPTPPVAFKAGAISLEDEAAKDDKEEKEKEDKEDKKEDKKEQKQKSEDKKEKSDEKKTEQKSSGSTQSEKKSPAPVAQESAPAAPAPQEQSAAPQMQAPALAVDVPAVEAPEIAAVEIPTVPVIPDSQLNQLDGDLSDPLAGGGGETDPDALEALNDLGETAAEEAARIAQEEADAIAAAEEEARIAAEEAARIAQEEADAIAAEEAARIAQEEADAIAAIDDEVVEEIIEEVISGGTSVSYTDVTSIAPLPDMTSTVITESTARAYTNLSYLNLEYGTWNNDTSFYVVGNVTPSEIVQSIMDVPPIGVQTYSLTGEAIKSINGVPQSGVFRSTIDMGIDFSSTPSFSGSIVIQDSGIEWYANIAGYINKYGFYSTSVDGGIYDIPNDAYLSEVVTGVIEGDFYGSDATEIGGRFALVDPISSTTMDGVFGGVASTALTPSSTGFSYLEYGTWADDSTNMYITGDLSSISDIQDLIDTSIASQVYTGTAEGIETVSGVTSSVSGTVNLTIDFANQVVSGDMTVGSWSAATISGTVDSYGFESTTITGTAPSTNALTGSLTGSFYGVSGSEVGGKFNFSDSTIITDTVSGVFGAN